MQKNVCLHQWAIVCFRISYNARTKASPCTWSAVKGTRGGPLGQPLVGASAIFFTVYTVQQCE